jgi:S-adenosylmethionine-dependent methyltransferase
VNPGAFATLNFRPGNLYESVIRKTLVSGCCVLGRISMPDKQKTDRFHAGADHYAAYLETVEGRLRTDLTLANLLEFLSGSMQSRSLRILDLGCGTGNCGVRLARLGFHVTQLDSSTAMLDIAKRAAHDAGVLEAMEFMHADITQLTGAFPARWFDAVICHNVLEYLDNPSTALDAAVQVMQEHSAILSILVRNQAGEVLKAALLSADLAAAERNLEAEWGTESLFAGPVRLFTAEILETLLRRASLEVITKRGVRVVSDYLHPQICREAAYQHIFELESKLGRREEFAAIARYSHYLLRRSRLLVEEHS